MSRITAPIFFTHRARTWDRIMDAVEGAGVVAKSRSVLRDRRTHPHRYHSDGLVQLLSEQTHPASGFAERHCIHGTLPAGTSFQDFLCSEIIDVRPPSWGGSLHALVAVEPEACSDSDAHTHHPVHAPGAPDVPTETVDTVRPQPCTQNHR